MDHPQINIVQQGHVYFWKYKTDGWLGSEWHTTADQGGRSFLLELFDRMAASDTNCEAVIRLTPVSQEILDIPGYDSPYKNMSELHLIYFPTQSYYYEWNIVVNQLLVEIMMGPAMLKEWRRAVQDVKAGSDSYAIGINEDHTVFVWPYAS